MSEIQESPETLYSGIGGWLILVGVGLVVTPIRLLVLIGKDLLPAFSDETWSILTTPGTNAYHPLWAPLLVSELIGNIILTLFSIVLAVLFFQQRKIVPKMIIVFLLLNLAFVAIDFFVADLIPVVANQNNMDSVTELGRSFIVCLIWVPYFLVSKRVKGTFIF